MFGADLGGKVFLYWSKPGKTFQPQSCASTWDYICEIAPDSELWDSHWADIMRGTQTGLMWIMRDTFFEAYRSKGGTDEYINAVMGLTANWMLPVVIVLGLVGGVIGAYLGKAILKKHFVKAGIV